MVKDATAHLPPGRASVANGSPVSGIRPGGGTTIGRPALTRVEQFTAGFAAWWAAPEQPPIPASSTIGTSTAARRRRQDATNTPLIVIELLSHQQPGCIRIPPGAVSDRLRHLANASRPRVAVGAETEDGPCCGRYRRTGPGEPHRHNGRIDTPREGGGICRAAQISRFTRHVQHKGIKSSSEHSGRYVCGFGAVKEDREAAPAGQAPQGGVAW
jgi:hypothetical protein